LKGTDSIYNENILESSMKNFIGNSGKRYFQDSLVSQSFIVMAVMLISLSGLGQVLAANPSQTQITKIDELQNVLDEVKNQFSADSLAVEGMFDSLIVVSQGYKPHLAYLQYYQGMFYFDRSDLVRAKNMQSSALNLARESNNDQLTAKILIQLGTLESAQGNNATSIEIYMSAIEAATRAGDHRTMGACYSLLGNIHRILGEYKEAISYITKAETHYSEIGFNEGAAWIQYSLANIYKDLELHEEALDYLYKSLDTYEKEVKDSLGVAICLDQIGDIYFDQKLFEEARQFVLRSNRIHSKANDSHGMAITLKNLGKIEYELSNFDKAIEFLEQSRMLKQGSKHVLVLSQIYEYMGRALFDLGRHQAGIDTAKTGLKLATDNQQRRMENRLYGVLAAMYREQGDLEIAYHYLSLQTSLTQLLADRLASVKITGMRNFHEREGRLRELNTLHFENQLIKLKLDKQKTTQILLALVMISFIGFSIVLIFMFLSKRKTLLLVNAQRKELEDLVATKNKFFSIISHDLRGPLGSTLQLMSTVIEFFPKLSKDRILELLKSMNDTSKKTFTLLENLPVWSRFQTGAMQVNLLKINLGEFIENELSMQAEKAKDKGIQLKSLPVDDLFVNADPDMLGTILRNLISNAIKFTPAGGEIKLFVSLAESDVLVRVEDTGIGIPAAEHENIFLLENKFNRKGTDGEESNGLGLILVRDFVEEMGGTISVESVINEGAAFTFSLKTQ